MMTGRQSALPHRRGFTLVELLTALVIIAILSGMAAVKTQAIIEQAKIAKAIGDIRTMQAEIQGYEIGGGLLPPSLADIGRDQLLDPWGRPYQYLAFDKAHGVPGGARKDRFLVPINSSFDLYSLGPDGRSVPPLQAAPDDVVRGNDGGFIGLARKF